MAYKAEFDVKYDGVAKLRGSDCDACEHGDYACRQGQLSAADHADGDCSRRSGNNTRSSGRAETECGGKGGAEAVAIALQAHSSASCLACAASRLSLQSTHLSSFVSAAF
eukprot:6207833-Pleurochrysis_carterae.AAC.1